MGRKSKFFGTGPRSISLQRGQSRRVLLNKAVNSTVDFTGVFFLPNPDPVPNILTGHQRLQIVSAHVVWWSLVYLLGHSLQEAHWNISGIYNVFDRF